MPSLTKAERAKASANVSVSVRASARESEREILISQQSWTGLLLFCSEKGLAGHVPNVLHAALPVGRVPILSPPISVHLIRVQPNANNIYTCNDKYTAHYTALTPIIPQKTCMCALAHTNGVQTRVRTRQWVKTQTEQTFLMEHV